MKGPTNVISRFWKIGARPDVLYVQMRRQEEFWLAIIQLKSRRRRFVTFEETQSDACAKAMDECAAWEAGI